MINTGAGIGFAKFIDHTNGKIDRTIAVYDMNRKYSKRGAEFELQKSNEELYKLFMEKQFYVEMLNKAESENEDI